MAKKLRYSDISHLPADHPDYIEFMRQIAEEELCYKGQEIGRPIDDEESLEYFDRYIAGDR